MARELFEFAVSLGADEALYSLALLLARGVGLPQDLTEAAKWATLALRNDPQGDARKLTELLSSQLPPDQLAQAQARAAAWRPQARNVEWERVETA